MPDSVQILTDTTVVEIDETHIEVVTVGIQGPAGAGLEYTDEERAKLAGIAPGATQNASDADLRDRTTHTGLQPIASVTGLQDALDGKAQSEHTHPVDDIEATNAPSASTYLRGDGQWVTPTNTTYSTMSSAEGQAGTSTSSRTMRADVLKALILFHMQGHTHSSADITDFETAVNTLLNAGIAAVINSSPAALDTLDELAAALGDDPNFATTVATQMGEKLSKSSSDTIADAVAWTLGTSSGLRIGTSASQKLGFYTATPVVQAAATTDLGTVLSALGLRAAGTAYPLTSSGAITFSGVFAQSGQLRQAPANITATATLTTSSAHRQRIVASTQAITITLPATTTPGIVFKLFRADNTAQTVTINGTFIGGTPNLNAQGKWIELISTATSGTWEVWGNN